MRILCMSLILFLLGKGNICLAQESFIGEKELELPEFSYSDGWLGGDGTLSTILPDGRVLWIFSDSYVSRNPKASKRKKANAMVSNTIAISTVNDQHLDTEYFWRKQGRKQLPFFISAESEYRFWPAWVFTRQDTVYVLMSKIGEKENPDPDDIFNFTILGNSLAMVTGTDATNPLQWNIELIPYSDLIPGETLNQAARDEHFLYVIKHSYAGNYLIRVPLKTLKNPGGGVEYWTEDQVWKNGLDGENRAILFEGQANGSLEYYPELGNWIYIYGPNFLSNEIKYRFAKQISGPWSDEGVLYVTPEQSVEDPAYDPRHFCYLARAHSFFFDPQERKLLITYDCNSTEFFHAAGSDFIYIPRVISVDVPKEIN